LAVSPGKQLHLMEQVVKNCQTLMGASLGAKQTDASADTQPDRRFAGEGWRHGPSACERGSCNGRLVSWGHCKRPVGRRAPRYYRPGTGVGGSLKIEAVVLAVVLAVANTDRP
jgi:hypothetical protein